MSESTLSGMATPKGLGVIEAPFGSVLNSPAMMDGISMIGDSDYFWFSGDHGEQEQVYTYICIYCWRSVVYRFEHKILHLSPLVRHQIDSNARISCMSQTP